MEYNWNPWHGCRKFSAGCLNCYMFRTDAKHGRDGGDIYKTQALLDPAKKKRTGEYKIPSGATVYTCFTSDFFLEDADEWRAYAWEMMRVRKDLNFFFLTKRIHRLETCLPDDWGDGYDNVAIGCTVEDQRASDERLPIFKRVPIKHKYLACEPLLGPITFNTDISGWIVRLVAGGESGETARCCDYSWILSLREQCVDAGVSFYFKQTGANFIKDAHTYRIPRKYQHIQARKAGIDYDPQDKK